jgi:exodeoxyribonuclease VII large subunit
MDKNELTSTENASLTPTPISVSELINRAKQALERALPLMWVSGEISGFKRATSGHCYFDLKDEQAQVACVLYRNRAALVGFELRDGAQVELRIHPSIYEPRGSLQFSVEQARLAGVGRLYEAFLKLKAKLEHEGVFDTDRKRELPALPLSIGLITSAKAAALADMLRVLRDRWPRAQVILYPASVQGSNAPSELLAALNAANARGECDVLIIGRGGGSIEDLWAFNDEALVRAVAASALPIVSAVGHETDFTLCDFAADLRAPTPSAAAAAVSPNRIDALASLSDATERMTNALNRRIDRLAERLDRVLLGLRDTHSVLAPWRERLLRLQTRIARHAQTLAPRSREQLLRLTQRYQLNLQRPPAAATKTSQIGARLEQSIHATLRSRAQKLQHLQQGLALLNPQHVLDRGYAVIFNANGELVSDAEDLATGQSIRAQLKRGAITAEVVSTSDNNR